jgi:hypothetical protein
MMQTPELEKCLGFDEADLTHNRSGRLSMKQGWGVVWNDLTGKIPSCGCGLFFFGIASIFPIVFMPMLKEAQGQIGAVIGIGAVMLIWGLAWGMVGAAILMSLFSRPNFTVEHVDGIVDITGKRRTSAGGKSRRKRMVVLEVGGQKFEAKADPTSLVDPVQIYRVYFLEGSKRVLSLERLGETGPGPFQG